MEEDIEELLKRKDNYDFAYGTQIYRPYTMSEKDWELIENLLTRYKQLEEENKKLKKYDIRNIKIGDDKILKSPSFTKEEIDLMNLGIALSTSFDVLFNDEREE